MRISLACFIVLASLPGTAGAAKLMPADHARATLRVLSACMARDNSPVEKKLMAQFLASSPNATDGKDLVSTVVGSGCFGKLRQNDDIFISKIGFSSQLLRGELFRTLYLDRYSSGQLDHLIQADAPTPWHFVDDGGFTALQRFGECVVRADPQDSRRAVNSLVASKAETRAYATLQPFFAKCISAGSTIKFSRSVLEGVLSEALYHLSGGPAFSTGNRS